MYVESTPIVPVSYVPRMMFFTKGRGVHRDHLTSFEMALRDAGIADLNLILKDRNMPKEVKQVIEATFPGVKKKGFRFW